jgi:hypothetical protein
MAAWWRCSRFLPGTSARPTNDRAFGGRGERSLFAQLCLDVAHILGCHLADRCHGAVLDAPEAERSRNVAAPIEVDRADDALLGVVRLLNEAWSALAPKS